MTSAEAILAFRISATQLGGSATIFGGHLAGLRSWFSAKADNQFLAAKLPF
jgi:hypothetical protein